MLTVFARLVSTAHSRWVSTLARLVLAGVLGVAGALKVADPAASIAAVRAYQLLPEPVERIVGYGLPFLELAVAALLLLGLAIRLAAVLAGLLMAAFVAGIASAWARGLAINCGCFGGGGAVAPEDTAYLPTILRDAGLLLLAAWLVWRPSSALALDGGDHPARTATPVVGEQHGPARTVTPEIGERPAQVAAPAIGEQPRPVAGTRIGPHPHTPAVTHADLEAALSPQDAHEAARGSSDG